MHQTCVVWDQHAHATWFLGPTLSDDVVVYTMPCRHDDPIFHQTFGRVVGQVLICQNLSSCRSSPLTSSPCTHLPNILLKPVSPPFDALSFTHNGIANPTGLTNRPERIPFVEHLSQNFQRFSHLASNIFDLKEVVLSENRAKNRVAKSDCLDFV
jgi:hypothetical protein